MITSIQKWGNSQGVRIPKNLLNDADLPEIGAVEIIAEANRIIIQKLPQRKPLTLQELFQEYEEEVCCTEWDTGAPVGKEVF